MIQINLFNSSENQHRIALVKAALKEFSSIKEGNKKKVHLVVYCHEKHEEAWSSILYPVVESGIDTSIAAMKSDTYIDKVTVASQSEHPYFCKWDDDVFINRHVWDFMIENIEMLDHSDVGVMCPTISNGIPSAGLFIQDYLDEEEKSIVHKIFLKDNIIPDIWGCNHQPIYDAVSKMNSWNDEKYWRIVDINNPVKDRNMPWYMFLAKGVHPCRFSYDYNMFLAKHAESNLSTILKKQEMYFLKYKAPYMCNNLFISRLDLYKEAQKMFFDHWDEGQLTAYMNLHDKAPIYVRNCYGIHMAYGCTKNQKEIENYYLQKVFEKL